MSPIDLYHSSAQTALLEEVFIFSQCDIADVGCCDNIGPICDVYKFTSKDVIDHT